MTRAAWKFAYCAPAIIRKVAICNSNKGFLTKLATRVYNRASVIPRKLVRQNLRIYCGKSFTRRRLKRLAAGFKMGEFAMTRKRALFKAKQNKKKKKKKAK